MHAQEEDFYYPKGDPNEWNLELTPFVWLPVISGQIESRQLEEEFDVPVLDLLGNLEMAFMINAEISKGKFFLSTTYVYTKLGAENTLWSSEDGLNEVVIEPHLKMNIFELIAGPRFRINPVFDIDPYAGFRYSNYNLNGSLEGQSTHSFEQATEFWDPIIGAQFSFYPHPRVPILFKTDIGGFGAGSAFSWTIAVNSGYTISPSIDLLAGFSAYGSNYERDVSQINSIGLDMNMYGIDLGLKYHIPKRKKDSDLFKN
jgi:hypothetical protein